MTVYRVNLFETFHSLLEEESGDCLYLASRQNKKIKCSQLDDSICNITCFNTFIEYDYLCRLQAPVYLNDIVMIEF